MFPGGGVRYNIATKRISRLLRPAANGGKMTKNYRANYSIEGRSVSNQNIADAVRNSVLTDTIADMSQDTSIHILSSKTPVNSNNKTGEAGSLDTMSEINICVFSSNRAQPFCVLGFAPNLTGAHFHGTLHRRG